MFPHNYPDYLKAIENFSADELEEEIERLKARKSIVSLDTVPQIDRMISATNARLEHQRIRETGGPSTEAREHVRTEIDRRRKQKNDIAEVLVHAQAKMARRNRFVTLVVIAVALALVIIFAILVTRS